ncbi:unnamed protein product [Adineta ricciae]|uniref:Phosphatidic acid phosphatase type 2/haloperoxidase domain-containing protein n=1 Tax=Adineta ricciae TaxID=249248 RepID=A0A815LPL9_ADIRI|nr:unnamed protein product [Adineta ricciae]CAF1410308.1 unnamed protein product [Adineta ricciae]
MLSSVHSLLSWLNEAEHVARFQRYFGVLPLPSAQPDLIPQTDKTTHLNTDTNSNLANQALTNLYHRHHERKITYDKNVLDECIQEINRSSNQNATKKPSPPDVDYVVTSWFWYYFFQIGSALGNEIFYILFFPTWIWNIDGCVARKVSMLWAFFMYIGQASKDILCIPRPSSPPVLQLEKRYVAEYGFPSTHAMFAAGIPFSLVFLSHQRYEFDLWIGLVSASIVCIWVCLSRIYLGMHSLLDIVGGTIYAWILVFVMFFYVETIDNFLLNHIVSPFLCFSLGIFLIKCYPSPKQWSTARSDTTIILGSTIGFLSASTIMNEMSLLEKPILPPVYEIMAPDLGLCVVRTILGLVIVGITREIIKTIVLFSACSFYGLDWKNPESKRFAKIEMPYYYLTYFAIGFNIGFTCPLVFRALGINRDYSYTEL